MEVNQEHINTLLNMGFHYEGAKRALSLAKNDLNEAVAILTDDHPTTQYDTLYDVGLDVEMREPSFGCTSQPTSSVMYGPSLPPTYDEAVEGSSTRTPNQETLQKDQSFEFPVANLYELENRVFTEQWSIPYKKEESLGRCLLAATKLAEEGLLETDSNCVRFIEKCLPEAFSKLLTSPAVHRWGSDIQEGICDMLQLLIDLISVRLAREPLPVDLLHVLAMVFNMETEFNSKNKGRLSERVSHWEELFGPGKVFAVCAYSYKDPYGWLTDLINQFAEKKGFEYVKERLEAPDLDAPSMAALFEPFGNCAELLNPAVVKPLLSSGLETALKYSEGLKETGFKDKKVGSVYDLLSSMKLLGLDLWPALVTTIDNVKIDITLKMLKSPHFNARMNALKEVSKMIEDSTRTRSSRSAINQDKILDWLVEEKVLSIALEGNIDQVQYCDKIKYIIEFLGANLSLEELQKIWRMQNGETTVVIDNIHSIVAAAAVKFNPAQLENLFLLIKKSWQEENDVMREKLLRLIGWIGRESKNCKITHKVLELLWDLAHLPTLKTVLIEQALDEHLTILSDSFAVKEPIKRQYIIKCVEDIREGKWVLPALRQILQITKSIAKHSYNKAEKATIQDLHKNYDIIKQVTSNLVKFHQISVQISKGGQLSRTTLVDGRYTHFDYVSAHLNFLQFLLQEGGLYLPWHRARDIWDTLAANAQACEWDREMCYEWFSKGIADLEQDTQAQLFQKELLKLDPSKLTRNGFQCFKCFFENVNQHENKLKKTGSTLTIEKTDLLGLDFLWKICLNTPDAEIAEMATSLLLNVSYLGLAPRYKRDPSNFHQKFINECNSWLELAMIPLEGSAIAATLLEATKILAATGIPSGSCLPSPSRSNNLLNIERLLLIAERYIVSVEELHAAPRSILPHGASFQGQPIRLNVHCDAHKTEFLIQAHANESVGSIRQKIAKKMKLPVEQIQFVPNEKVPNRDQKLLNQLCLEDNQVLNIRIASSTTISSYPSSQDLGGTSARQSLDLEEEKMLPGVIMSNGGQVFEMLYHLASLDQPRITNRARSLLKLIPTNPAVVELLDSISHRSSRGSTTVEKEPSPKLTPHNSPRRQLGSSSNLGTPQSGLGMIQRVGPSSSSSQIGLASLKASSSSASLASIAANARSSPRDILRGMLTSASSGITMFQVLYNLEVLSSRLMPTQRDVTTLQSARKFCDDFLDAGGLNLVIGILQKEAISPDVDCETRQGCYAVALQLLRFLFCGQDVTGEAYSVSAGRRSSGGSTAASAISSGGGSGPPSLESMGIACRAIQNMDVNEFTEMVGCFMRVTWAAAAGKLQLVGSMQPIKDALSVNVHSSRDFGGRQSIGSNGSGTSSGSESDLTCLHAGICVKQKQVSSKDTYISVEALELLVACLQLRSSLLAVFYTLPCVGDFMVDVLVGSPQQDIRNKAVEQLNLLSKTDFLPTESTGHQQTPHQFILQTLQKARLPFWVSSSKTRGASYRLLQQCKQYFELKCLLLSHLTADDQNRLMVDARRMLEDEINWLVNFVPSEHGGDIRFTDNTLLAGHLRLIQTLLTCENVDKVDAGKHLIHDLLYDFLFPASKIIVDATNGGAADMAAASFTARCSESESRVAAYEVLVELARGNLENMKLISYELVRMHHQPNLEMATQWEYMPPVDSRTGAGFVGLKNGGATCYMNSLLQQLYMTPGIAEFLLAIDDEEVDEESVLFQVQQVMGHLLESKLQYYEPERFWQVFRLWGKAINVREQQDALDFFQALIDQLDEQIIKLGKDPIFKKNFQGFFSDQKICKDCQHRYEQEELFFALNVTVKNATLQESLDQFVKGELLEGENAYFCEKCGIKRNTIKRMCIKTLPPVLCIQLKRFDYDWEANRAIKFDDFFRFPFVLDMEPYTAEGMAWREQLSQSSHDTDGASLTYAAGDMMSDDSSTTDLGASAASSTTRLSETSSSQLDVPKGSASGLYITSPVNTSHIDYELVGVVVHSGQANAGHYYSFIKDRRGNYMTNPNKGKWYRFNDTVVEEFEMTDANLEAECFGGKYKAKVYDSIASNSHPEERLRYWNGYLLFYERVEDVRTPISAKKSKMSMFRMPSEKSGFSQRQDSLKQLTELVHKGEKKGLFSSRMPARIQQVVREENLHFMKNRNVYDVDYFLFVRKLASVNISNIQLVDYTQMCLASLELSIRFLFNTYFRTKSRLRMESDEWATLITTLLQHSKESCGWFVEFLALEEGSAFIKPFILECPSKEIRVTFGKMLDKTLSSFFQHGGVPIQKSFNDIIELLLSLLSRDVVEHYKHCFQYFQVLASYTQMGIKSCSHMFGRSAFKRLMEFLIGSVFLSSEQEVGYRRWSSVQAREFGPLHATLAGLILSCDLSQFRTLDPAQPQFQPYKPTRAAPQTLLKMPPEMQRFVFGPDFAKYLREVVLALREVTTGVELIQEMLLYCSSCNLRFSIEVLKSIMVQCLNAPSNELKSLFLVLLQLLLLEDQYQLERLRFVIDGSDNQVIGTLSAISQCHTSDSRRSYQVIKFLVSLATKCPLAKDYLLQAVTKWQWAVNWLQSKMSEHLYWNPHTDASNEDPANTQSFQRTISAQDTLAEATALLTEFSAHEQDMEISKPGERGEETAETSRSSSPVVFTTHSPAEQAEDFDTIDRDIS